MHCMPYWHISTQNEPDDDSSQSVRESHHAWSVSTGTFSSMPCIVTRSLTTPFSQAMVWSMGWLVCIGDVDCTAEEVVTIDKSADSKQNELQGWKASARNPKHLEQHLVVQNQVVTNTQAPHTQYNARLRYGGSAPGNTRLRCRRSYHLTQNCSVLRSARLDP
jgi:hypothetical protein